MTDFDAIVVGAGPAGSSAALFMAAGGMKVVLLERGDYPGAKNMFGGVVYSEAASEVVPEFWREAPLERAVTRDSLWFLDKDSAVEMGFTGLRFAQSPYNKFTALRPDFDRWLAGKAVAAGAVLENRATVHELVYEKKTLGRGPVSGVLLSDGTQLTADLVVLAEGVNASLAKKAGLAKKFSANSVSLWIREVISLPAEKIEDRFLLGKNEGAVLAMLGYPTTDAVGLAGIFTNRESVSLTLGLPVRKLVQNRLNVTELLSRLKEHPHVKRLISGGTSEGFAAHMIPRGGHAMMPKLYSDGLLIAGDAAIMISGRHGYDLAMLSGKLAAQTAIQARLRRDFSSDMLKIYKHKLENTYFMKNIRHAGDKVKYYDRYSDSDYLVNTLANDLAYQFFKASLETDREKITNMSRTVMDKQPWLKSMADVLAGLQNWGVL